MTTREENHEYALASIEAKNAEIREMRAALTFATWSVLREFNLDSCEGGAACDEVECVGSRKIAGEVIRLRTTLTLATQRAEAAEAAVLHEQILRTDCEGLLGDAKRERDALRDLAKAECDSNDSLRAERDALRKVDDAMVERFMVGYEVAYRDGNTHRFSTRAALDAALAVQP